MAGAGLLFITAMVLILVACCYYRKISLAGRIVSTATNFMTSQCTLAFLPVVMFILLTIFILYWLALAVGFYSLGKPITVTHSLPFQHF